MAETRLARLAAERFTRGLPAVCSAHPWVLDAALRAGRRAGTDVLIEATCNQVNQEGGYTGLTPAAFRRDVAALAAAAELAPERLILGGDHLGPNPWKHLPPEAALERAAAMVAAYAAAGFAKLHIDASMGCAGEAAALPDEIVAARAARLVAVAEAAARRAGQPAPFYVIGTEVPIPGGAAEDFGDLHPTAPAAVGDTLAVHRAIFRAAGLEAALARVIAVVVQPGVEFAQESVALYRPERAAGLRRILEAEPGLVFEAHSTDYQPQAALAALVADGFAVLKVGPGLSFALREALYGLDLIAGEIVPGRAPRALLAAMEALMQARPGHWQGHAHGDAAAQHRARHYGLSDRIRYYWPETGARAAVAALMAALAGRDLPLGLIGQHLGAVRRGQVAAGRLAPRADALAAAAIGEVLADYAAACRPTSVAAARQLAPGALYSEAMATGRGK